MTIKGRITRTELGDSNLSLHQPGKYLIVDPEPGPGMVTWRRQLISSPYVHGSTLVGATKENPVIVLNIAVFGSSSAAIAGNMSTLLRAFEQFSYDLELEVDGEDYEYRCQMADYGMNADGRLDLRALRGRWQVVTLRIPRNPTPIDGSH